MTSSRPSAFSRLCATVVAAALTLQPLGAYGALITTSVLAETPLQGLSQVKPNIMLTIDDSSSMLNDYLPDFTSEKPGMCRDNFPCGATPGGITGTIITADPPIRSSDFNGQFYNPSAGVTYLPGVNAAGLPLPCEGSNVACSGPWTAVYVDGYANYPGANNGATINLVNGYPDTVYCNGYASNPPTAADLATASVAGDGSRCRFNGRPYPQSTSPTGTTIPAVAAGYNYPNLRDQATGGFTAGKCPDLACLFGHVALHPPVIVLGNPFYYTITQVQFCRDKDSNSPFGLLGSCSPHWDETKYPFVRYGTNPSLPFDPQAFKRVDILPTGFLVNGLPASNPSGRSYPQEMANFARWYAFDRTRLLAMKTAGGRGFVNLDDTNARVGLHTLAENDNLPGSPSRFLNVAPFDGTHKEDWFTKFYGVAPPSQTQTPLPDAAYRIGEYFKQGGNSGLPNAQNPIASATGGECQKNAHLMATDGYWNKPLSLGTVGDTDKDVPDLPAPVAGFKTGDPFPAPYWQGPTPSNNTLADIAMKYWITDLSDLPDKVADLVAPWQHLTLYGVSIGAQGLIAFPDGLNDIKASGPDLTDPNNKHVFWPVPTGTGTPDSIDDLWHAAVNSRGDFYNAANPQQLAESIVSVINSITGSAGTGAAVGIAGAQLTAANGFAYATGYDSKWTGDVKKYPLNPATGAIDLDTNGNPIQPSKWSAQAQLDKQVLGSGWDTARRIVTIDDTGTTGSQFRFGSLSGMQQAELNKGWLSVTPTPTGQQVLDYLRGDNSSEGIGTSSFRIRTHTLGDIVYSGAVTVAAPREPYDDAGNPGFEAFRSAQANRTPMVYVGANDGMMHAFIDTDLDLDGDGSADGGKEAWAYVPNAIFFGTDPNDSSQTVSPAFSIGSLTYRVGGIPLFQHRFFVNATPRIWDIDLNNTTGSTPAGNNWTTMLVSGLGAGGRAVFALDATQPVQLTDTEASVTNRVMWEFTDNDLGYVFDSPTLVKTKAFGWVVLVASGYNSPTGKGFLFVLNPKTGAIRAKIPTEVGSPSDPSGLSTIRAFTASRKDPYVLQAYGGDLKGNVWRFDLSDADASKWSSKAERVALLKDSGGKPQPITTGVRIEIDQNNGVDRYIFVGTGKLLGPGDIADESVTNSLYVIKDGTVSKPDDAPVTSDPRTDLNQVFPGIPGFAGAPTGRGWFQDGAKSEKIGIDVFADLNTVIYAFSKPQPDPCLGVLSSTLYARDLLTGGSVLQSQGGTDIIPSVDIGQGIAGIALIQGESSSPSSAGNVNIQVTTMKGEVFSFGVQIQSGSALRHRVSWRLISRD